jgi:uncharacterized protein (DUF2267 family)
MMTHDEFASCVAELAGLAGPQEADGVVRAVLEVIGERMGRREAESLAQELPPQVGAFLQGEAHGQDFDVPGLHARVARREGIRLGIAVEHTVVVCQVVAEAISPAALYRLHQALPEPLAALFKPREPVERFEHIRPDPRRGTLAEGRPGGCHPLYEARPGQAQSQSVVCAENPHEETKLSSARGLTQEREHETLAEGHPGSSRPLSDAS